VPEALRSFTVHADLTQKFITRFSGEQIAGVERYEVGLFEVES
jgi:hypothetical protein